MLDMKLFVNDDGAKTMSRHDIEPYSGVALCVIFVSHPDLAPLLTRALLRPLSPTRGTQQGASGEVLWGM